MNQIEFMRRWCGIKPAQVKRRTWFDLGMRIHAAIHSAAFAVREPRFWWYCRRVTWHYRYGLTLPPKPPYTIEA